MTEEHTKALAVALKHVHGPRNKKPTICEIYPCLQIREIQSLVTRVSSGELVCVPREEIEETMMALRALADFTGDHHSANDAEGIINRLIRLLSDSSPDTEESPRP